MIEWTTGINCEATMRRITVKFFKCAERDFKQKLQKFHRSLELSQEERISTYENFKLQLQNLFLPVLSNEGMYVGEGVKERGERDVLTRLCVCVKEREEKSCV